MDLGKWALKYGVSHEAVSELLVSFFPAPTGAGAPEGTEARAQKDIRLQTNVTNGILLRNNSGVATDATGRAVRFGLGNDSGPLNKKFKSSDLIGLTPIEGVGVFTAIEVKRPGWKYSESVREKGQLNFINTIKARGGIAGFATGPQDYLNLIEDFKK